MLPINSSDSFWDAFWEMPRPAAYDKMFFDAWETYCMGGEL